MPAILLRTLLPGAKCRCTPVAASLQTGRGAEAAALGGAAVLKLLALRDELLRRGLGSLLQSWTCPQQQEGDKGLWCAQWRPPPIIPLRLCKRTLAC